jgi:hypothetical protein|tara:strand:+ start:200 stop:391 length:192 start_codon:yes stop_codon:yes gene_type:complete
MKLTNFQLTNYKFVFKNNQFFECISDHFDNAVFLVEGSHIFRDLKYTANDLMYVEERKVKYNI